MSCVTWLPKSRIRMRSCPAAAGSAAAGVGVTGASMAPSSTATAAPQAALAYPSLAGAVAANLIVPHTIHADRGGSMTSKPVSEMMIDLSVRRSHSRPQCSNDNPYSEAQFKTLKYRPDFPERFGALEDARAHSAQFFRWYNTEHRHSALGLLTPHDVHDGLAETKRAARAAVLATAYAATPERFVRRPPTPPALPTAAWINPPTRAASSADAQ